MSSTIQSRLEDSADHPDSAGVARSEPGGRAQRRAGAARRSDPHPELADRVKELLPDGVIDELLAGASTEQRLVGQGGLLGQLTKRLVERAMEVELTDYLGYETHVGAAGRDWEHPQRQHAEAADHRARRGRCQHAPPRL